MMSVLCSLLLTLRTLAYSPPSDERVGVTISSSNATAVNFEQ
jgi:hypothetical protein